MSYEDDKATAIFGSTFLFLFFLTVVLVSMKGVYEFFARVFTSLGDMASSFLYFLWNIGLVVAVIAITVGGAVSVYGFVKSYLKMVNDATDLQSWVKTEVYALEKLWRLELGSKLHENKILVQRLDEKLEAALEKPDVSPETPPVTVVDEAAPPLTPPAQSTPDDVEDLVIDLSAKSESTVTMSNPY